MFLTLGGDDDDRGLYGAVRGGEISLTALRQLQAEVDEENRAIRRRRWQHNHDMRIRRELDAIEATATQPAWRRRVERELEGFAAAATR